MTELRATIDRVELKIKSAHPSLEARASCRRGPSAPRRLARAPREVRVGAEVSRSRWARRQPSSAAGSLRVPRALYLGAPGRGPETRRRRLRRNLT